MAGQMLKHQRLMAAPYWDDGSASPRPTPLLRLPGREANVTCMRHSRRTHGVSVKPATIECTSIATTVSNLKEWLNAQQTCRITSVRQKT
jgi:hypothetical protein